ncbi:MAG: PAS domain S-box protein, partial [Bacteroidota bacterium]
LMSPDQNEIDRLKRKVARERNARKEAEQLLEKKSLELYQANEKLKERARQKEVILERTERKFASIIENAQDLIYRMDPNGVIVYANNMCLKKMGFSENESIGVPFFNFIHPDFREVISNFYGIQLRDKVETTYQEFAALTKDGDTLWLGQNVQLIYQDGELVEIFAIARDLSEQRTVQRQLYATTLRLSTLIKTTHSGILVEDENRDIILVNDQFCLFFEIPVSADELVGTNCADSAEQSKHLFVDSDHFVSRINEILKIRDRVVGEELVMGNGIVLERDYIPLFDKREYKGHVWQYRDITERKESEKLLRVNEEKYRSIIENMELGLMEVSSDGIILRAYDRFCEMVGYRQEELLGKRADEVFLPPEYREVMEQQDKDRAKGQGGVYEIEMLCKGGRRISVLISGAPVMEGNQLKSTLGIHYDISDRKNLERDLIAAKKVADEAREMEKQFLANMSHEIRNPINAVIGVANLLYDTPLNPEQLEYLNTIKYSSDVLLQLISGILDLSKIESGKVEISEQPVDLRAMANAIIQTYEFKESNNKVAFKADVDEDVPELVMCDNVVLNQILLNLFGNAVKFTAQGQITLRISVRPHKESSKKMIEFQVSDTGIGISPDKLQTIFESFKQETSDTQLKYGGTGLGLSIVKSLVDQYAGDISVESEPEKGSIFTVALPLSEVNSGQKRKQPQQVIDHSQLALSRVLIVEDNTINQVYLSGLLKKWGINYDIASNGLEALEEVKDHQYDLILMDIRMPEMDGYETTIQIRANKNNPNNLIPIIALTASALVDEKDKALAVGMDFHLTKPFAPEALLGLLSELSGNHDIGGSREDVFQFSSDLDSAYLNELYANDLERAQLMFQIFLKNIEKEIDGINGFIADEDWRALAALSHKLKPNF